MKIKLHQSSTNAYMSLINATNPSIREYCERWNVNYSLRTLPDAPGRYSGAKYYRNVLWLEEIKDCDWFWFMGADSVIMNHTIDVRSFLDDRYDLIIGRDVNSYNNDVFFLKNTPESIAFLEWIVQTDAIFENDDRQMVNYIHNGPDMSRFGDFRPRWHQMDLSLLDTMHNATNFKTKIVHQKEFNCYLYEYYDQAAEGGQFEMGDFILHLPGMANETRLNVFSQYIPQIIR